MKNKMLTVMVMFALVGFSTFAFAGKGMGPGKGGGCAALKNLSAEDQAKVKAEQDAFLKDTQTLRDQIKQKHDDLKAEMVKTDTDEQKAFAIQKEITDLMTQMAQKRLQHQLNLKKINPALGSCGEFMGGRGPGMGPGAGMGQGKGPGMNPNCPYNNNTNTPAQTQGKTL
jgi:Spy/CpxP family protein refolding chaperone